MLLRCSISCSDVAEAGFNASGITVATVLRKLLNLIDLML